MLTWNKWSGTAQEWNDLLARFPDHNVYQSYGWGEHKSHYGWIPVRLVGADDSGNRCAVAQVLIKRLPLGVALGWCPGGPIGPGATLDAGLRSALRKAVGAVALYCRINRLVPGTAEESDALGQAGWRRPTHRLLSGHSIFLDLAKDHDEWLSSIDKKHRYYVKKSTTIPISWESGDSPELRRQLVGLTRRLSQEKGMPLQERTETVLDDLAASMSGSLHILIGSMSNEPATGCMVLRFRNRGIYATAATVGPAREASAAYAMFAVLRRQLRDIGVSLLDFGGINPAVENARGVDHFKRGFGGQEVKYCGEWDWASVPGLRRTANLLISRRAGGM